MPSRMRLLIAALSLLTIVSCGVKLPPVAPQRDPDPVPPPNMDCSPSDENCDKTDPNYRPRKR